MHGIVTLLEDEHATLVRRVWRDLARRFDVHGIDVTPHPHISWQSADRYDQPALHGRLTDAAAAIAPLTIRTTGLAAFTGPHPVLYVPVVRSAEVSAVHMRIWQALRPIGHDIRRHTAPELWVPHISLGHNDIDLPTLGAIVEYLAARRFEWAFPLTNLALVEDTDDGQRITARYELGG